MSEHSDECPELVSTDEEEEIPVKKMIGPEIPAVLKRDTEVAKDLRDYIKKEERLKQVSDSLRILIVDPFLFGTDNSAKKHNKAWIAAASQKFGFPQSGESIMHAVLGYENQLAVQLLEKACAEVNDYLSDRKLDTLKMFKISDQIRKDYKDDKLVNVDRYSDERVVEEICIRIIKAFPEEDSLNSAAKFAVLYVLNTWTFFANRKFRFGEDVTSEVDKENLSQTGEENRVRGNEKFKECKFEMAIGYYKRAIEENPHSYVYYGNRAQAYLRLKKFLEAASDGRRAVSLKPDWIKGLYRYAEALYELRFLDEARDINKRAAKVLEQSGENAKDRDKVRKQSERISKLMAEDKENDVEPISNRILEKKKEENSKIKKTVENVKNTADKGQKKKKVEIESDDDIPALASAESSSEDDDVTILDRASEMKLNDELKSSKPRDHEEFRMHQELMEKKKRTEKILVEGKKKKEAVRWEKIQEETIRKEKEKERELAEANKKVEPEKKKGPLKTGTCAKPVKLEKSTRVNGTDALQSIKKKDIEKLKNMLGMGSQALLALRSRNAIDHYVDALDFITSKNLTYFSLDMVDVMVLKYAHGVALLEAGTLQRILDGIATFEALLKDYPKQSFPLAYYGIGRGYIKQNRYRDAIEHLDHGLAIVKKKNSNSTVLTWPGSSVEIKETSPPGKMKESFEDLLYLCRHPPHPDAMCFYTDCHGFYKKEIYFSDPDFQGFVRTVCYAKCMIDFHITCWKKFRTATEDRHSEKDYLERPCFTPDCYACIVKVLIYDKDGLAKKEFTSEVDHHHHKQLGNKPKIRQELTNEKKIKRKEEKKALRKQRKMEAQARREEEQKEDDILEQLERRLDERQTEETGSVTTDDMDSRSHTTGGGVVEEDPLPKEKDMTVLKKELSPGEKYKVVTAKKTKKKKKDKTKTTLSLDEFVGRDHAQEDDDEYDPDKPFSVPSQLRSDIEAFENCHFVTGGGDCSVALTPAEEEIVANLYSFFEDHLRASGPVYLHDQTLAELMEEFPPEAKDVIRKYDSLSNFLLQNLKFAMMDEHLCLLKDSVTAKKMAEEKRRQGTKYQSYSQSVSASSDVPGGPVIHSMGTSLNPSAMEFSPSGTMLNSDSAERTRHGDLCDFELPLVAPRGSTTQRKYSEDEFPTLGDIGMDRSVRSDSVSRASLSDSLSSSCDDMKGDLSDSKSGGSNYQKGSGTMEVPPFLSGPPRAAKKMLPQNSNSGSSDKVPPFMSGPPLARNIGGSPRMGSPKLVSPKRASQSSQENMEHKRNIPDEFKRQVLAKLKREKMDSGSDTPPVASGKEEELDVDNEMPPFTVGNEAGDLDETYQSDSGNSLDDLDGVDDVVVTATDTQKLDGEDYDANLDVDLNKTFEKAVGKGRSASKTIFDQAPGVSHDPSMYSWNVKGMNNGTKRAVGNNPNIGKPDDSDNLSHKMQLAREAWSTADSTRTGDYCSFPSVHSGPGFGGLPFKIPTSASFPSQTDTNEAEKYSSGTGLDDMDDSNIFSEILDSNANGDDKHLDNSSRHSDSFTSDINISAEKEIDQMDEDFVHEFSSSVMVGLKSHSAFAEDDNLADLVRSTIEKDLQRCAVSKALNSAMGTHFGRSNSGSTVINRDFLRKPAILCRSIAVQSELLHRGVDHAVQTDPYEPYKLERDALQQQLVELNQMLAQTKNVCHMQRQRYEQLKDSYEDAKKHLVTLNSVISENEREKLQLEYDYRNAQEEIRRIKEQLHQSQAQEQSMMMRMNELQQTINNITKQKQEEVERMTAERNHHINIIQQLEANVQQNVATARATEVELLEFKLDIGMQLMEKHMKDADHYFTNLQAVVKKYEDGNHPIPQQLLRSVDQWQKTKDLIQETAQNCTQSFQEQIQKVKEGTILASLPKLDLPRAPPPPDPLPSQMLRPPMNIQFQPGQAPGGPGQQRMSPTELRNSPSPTTPLPGLQFQSRPQGPVPQSLPSFAQMPKQPPGMQAGSRPGAPPGGRPSYQGPVPSGNLQQAQTLQEQSPTPFTLQPKPTATVNPTGAYATTAKIINEDSRPKMPPGFQGPSAGPPGMGLPSQPPLGGPPGAAQGPPSLVPPKKTAAPKNSFEKIMVNLAKMFPNYKRQQLMGFVQKLRTVRSGSLTGMTLDDIICEVANMILENNPGAVSSVKGQGGASGLATFNDSGSSSPSSGLSGNQTPISNFEDEDPCVICHEEMTPGTIVSLDCQHIFHDECIRKWLQEQRTCPTCRKYALLADEFPSLG